MSKSGKFSGKMIIVAAPSGAGKSTFVTRILQDIPALQETVTYTTRKIREGEKEGEAYFFVSEKRFLELIDCGFFVEWANVHEKLYGTPQEQLDKIWSSDKVVIMDVDIQGSQTFRSKFSKSFGVFILPPSTDELRRRVIERDGSNLKDLELRMSNAEKEIEKSSEFNVQIVNDDYEQSYAEFKKVIEEYLEKA